MTNKLLNAKDIKENVVLSHGREVGSYGDPWYFFQEQF